MAKLSIGGTCILCRKSFSKPGMTRHLQMCRQKDPGGEGGPGLGKGRKKQGFHLVVEGLYRPEYWMHLEIADNARLEALDFYLRRTWLECCGHMSAFVIRGRNHFREDRGIWADLGDLDMEVTLKETLRPRMKFIHEYDFGSTTELTLRVISQDKVSVDRQGIRLLARNDPPAIPCFKCDAQAARICTECVWDGEGFYCHECSALHTAQSPDHEEMFLPVVNSPRMGECTFTGPDNEFWALGYSERQPST